MSKKGERRKKGFATEAYQLLFEEIGGEQALEDLRADRARLLGYRTKTYRCGEVVEVEVLPILAMRADASAAKLEAAKDRHREAQRRVNQRNAEKRLSRIANLNFTERDLFLTLTYTGEAPDPEQATKDIQAYMRRVRKWMREQGNPEPLRYLFVIEYEDDPERQQRRIHHHVIMTGIDRDAAERIWTLGRANARRLQPDDHGLTGLTCYMLKDPKGKKRWGYSTNLKKPEATESTRKMSKRKVEQLAMQFDGVSREVLERAYPGYRFVDCEVKTSKFVPGAYIYARMIRDPAKERGGGKG